MHSYLFWLKFNFESIKIKNYPLSAKSYSRILFPFLNDKSFMWTAWYYWKYWILEPARFGYKFWPSFYLCDPGQVI